MQALRRGAAGPARASTTTRATGTNGGGMRPTHRIALACGACLAALLVLCITPVTRRLIMGTGGLLGAGGLAAGGAALADADERLGVVSHTPVEWKRLLGDDLSYRVLRQAATEKPGTSPLNKEKRKGVFTCRGCGNPLYKSDMKYESGTGWPSFFDVIPGAIDEMADASIFFMPRTEVRCHKCQGHIGHVFDDGPKPTGLRYCMNGAAMAFVQAEGEA